MTAVTMHHFSGLSAPFVRSKGTVSGGVFRRTNETGNDMTEAMPFLQKAILLSYDPLPFGAGQETAPAHTVRGGRGFEFQHILAPAGMASSRMRRFSFSSPRSVWTAEMSMPLDSSPIIFRGGRLTMATRVLPTSSSGL